MFFTLLMTDKTVSGLRKIVPHTKDRLIKFLFWHSMFFTLSTPIMRGVRGTWLYVASVPTALGREDGIFEAYPPTTERLDRAWIPHAFFGLLWLCFGAFQMINFDYSSPNLHKHMGKVATLVFLGHMAAAAYNLYTDALNHTWVNKVLLSVDLYDGFYYMVRGLMDIYGKKNDWRVAHKDHMFLAFISSIEGAGTIRTIANFHWLLEIAGLPSNSFLYKILGTGLGKCQATYRTVGTVCEVPYSFRLLWVRFLSNCYVSIYTSFTPRMDRVMKSRWSSWTSGFVVAVLGFALGVNPGKAMITFVIAQLALYAVENCEASKFLPQWEYTIFTKSNDEEKVDSECMPTPPCVRRIYSFQTAAKLVFL